MTLAIATCLAIVLVAVILFAWDRIPADVVALGVMLAIIATGLLPADKAFAGFSSDTVMMILGLLLMSAGLVQTGVVDIAGGYVFALAGRDPRIFLPVILVSIAVMSAFMSNTAATAFFVPLVLGYAARIGASPSHFLLPIAFASILASSVTLISTSTNLVVSDLFTRYQQPPMGMFELAPVGVSIAVLGVLYVWLVGVRLMPTRGNQASEQCIGERTYQADVVVGAESPLLGKSLNEAKINEDAGFKVVKLVRRDRDVVRATELAELTLEPEDELFIEGLRADLLKIKDLDGLDFKADVKLADVGAKRSGAPSLGSAKKATRAGDAGGHEARDGEGAAGDAGEAKAEAEAPQIVEGVLLPRSPLIGYSLARLGFKERYGLDVLAIHRAGRLPSSISHARLRMGDVLLLQGSKQAVSALERGNLFNIFGSVQTQRLNRRLAPVAAGIFIAAIAAVTLKLVSLPVAMIGGAFAMFLTRCMSPDVAYRQVEWKAIILIGALLSMGAAMDASGAGKYLAQQLIALVGGDSPRVLLTLVFVLTVALTQPMSNQAAALVVFPIAIEMAAQLGVNPRAFGMMVAISASVSYLTPLEPACLLVYGPGKYRFSDFFKVGAPLTLLIYAIAIVMVPIIWPLDVQAGR